MNHSDPSFHAATALLHSATRSETGEQPADTARAPFTITISREVGAQGTTVAKEVGALLGWPVYDQEILDKVAEQVKRPSYLLRGLDERPANWLDTVVAGMASDFRLSPSAYVKYLVGVVRGLARVGHCILVGRGASHFLPSRSTLRVRLVASAADRARVVSRLTGLTDAHAVRWMEETEKARLEFVRNYFGVDAADPHLYDLVLNTSNLPVAPCARLIVDALRVVESRTSEPSADLIAVGATL